METKLPDHVMDRKLEGIGAVATQGCPEKPDISILEKTGHFYLGLTGAREKNKESVFHGLSLRSCKESHKRLLLIAYFITHFNKKIKPNKLIGLS